MTFFRSMQVVGRSRPSEIVIILSAGDVIAADGILTKSSDLHVDESTHTGESDDVYKSTDTDPTLYGGQ